jgi:hypothetical protein
MDTDRLPDQAATLMMNNSTQVMMKTATIDEMTVWKMFAKSVWKSTLSITTLRVRQCH